MWERPDAGSTGTRQIYQLLLLLLLQGGLVQCTETIERCAGIAFQYRLGRRRTK